MRSANEIIKEAQALFDKGEVEQAAMILRPAAVPDGPNRTQYPPGIWHRPDRPAEIRPGHVAAADRFAPSMTSTPWAGAIWAWPKFMGRDDLALAAYEKALALDPNMPEVLAGVAGYWINRDSIPEGRRLFGQGAESQSDAPRRPHAPGHGLVGAGPLPGSLDAL
jgi:hypothetical protein